jgi:hypothetical protein
MTSDTSHTPRFIAVEFFGRGDPFFGGTADDRPLLNNGRFASHPRRKEVAEFPTKDAALKAARKAPNRREGGLLTSWDHAPHNS